MARFAAVELGWAVAADPTADDPRRTTAAGARQFPLISIRPPVIRLIVGVWVNHPLLAIAVFIVTFLEIHPFQDGNGRLSRVLTTLLLLQAGYAYVPYSSLESVIENSKEAYYLALRQTQSTIRTEAPDWQPWLSFFLRAMQQQKRRLAVKLEREKNALAVLPALAVKILDYARDQGRVTTRDMVREAGASPNTLKSTFKSLVEKGRLARHGGGRSTWYSLP